MISDSKFVQDLSVDDGTFLDPGQGVEKRWLLRNTGETTWGDGFKVVQLARNSHMMGAALFYNLSDVASKKRVAPGETVEIKIALWAPKERRAQPYVSRWQLQDERGHLFGTTFYMEIVVPSTPTGLAQDGRLPHYRLMQVAANSQRRHDGWVNLEGELGPFDDVVTLVKPVIPPDESFPYTISNAEVTLQTRTQDEFLITGEIIDENILLESPDESQLVIQGQADFFDMGVDVTAVYFVEGIQPHSIYKLALPTDQATLDPAWGFKTIFSIFPDDLPLLSDLEFIAPQLVEQAPGLVNVNTVAVIISTKDELTDPLLDADIVRIFNFYGAISLNEVNHAGLKFIRNTFGRQFRVHAGVELLETGRRYFMNWIIDRHIPFVQSRGFNATYTRTDIGLKIDGQPPEPTLSLSSDVEFVFMDGEQPTQLTFTGGAILQSESFTLFYSLNGRDPGAQNQEWKDPFGIPGLTIRELSLQLGFTPSTIIDNIGLYGNLKIGKFDGQIAFLIDINDPDQFVLAAKIEDITLLDLLGSLSPPMILVYNLLDDGTRQVLNEVINIRLRDIDINIVPTATTIGLTQFDEEGITLNGEISFWGWRARAHLNVDYETGFLLDADMDPLFVPNQAEPILTIVRGNETRMPDAPTLSATLAQRQATNNEGQTVDVYYVDPTSVPVRDGGVKGPKLHIAFQTEAGQIIQDPAGNITNVQEVLENSTFDVYGNAKVDVLGISAEVKIRGREDGIFFLLEGEIFNLWRARLEISARVFNTNAAAFRVKAVMEQALLGSLGNEAKRFVNEAVDTAVRELRDAKIDVQEAQNEVNKLLDEIEDVEADIRNLERRAEDGDVEAGLAIPGAYLTLGGLYEVYGTAWLALEGAEQFLEGLIQSLEFAGEIAIFIIDIGLGGLVDITYAEFDTTLDVVNGGTVMLRIDVTFLKKYRKSFRLAFDFANPAKTAQALANSLINQDAGLPPNLPRVAIG